MATDALFNCSTCGHVAVRTDSAKFCPLCGQAWFEPPAMPLRLTTSKRSVDVGMRLAEGSSARL